MAILKRRTNLDRKVICLYKNYIAGVMCALYEGNEEELKIAARTYKEFKRVLFVFFEDKGVQKISLEAECEYCEVMDYSYYRFIKAFYSAISPYADKRAEAIKQYKDYDLSK